ncbi:Uncharacterised protein [Chlamydia trachomatis]|nr:Uncharacterised protein [Chlamydia trachomatis]
MSEANSLELALIIPLCLACATVIACIPKQIPKVGILCSFVKAAALTLFSKPRFPKPGKITTPSAVFKFSKLSSCFFALVVVSKNLRSTSSLLYTAQILNASTMDL